MRTIVHVIDSLIVGGAEVLLMKTIPLLKNYNNIICYLHKPDDLAIKLKDCHIYYLGFEKRTDFFKAVNRLRKVIKDSNASVVHSHLLWSTWVARAACTSNVKLITTIHNLLSKDAFLVNKISLFIEKLTYTKNQVIIGVSNEVLKDYDHYVGIKGPNYLVYNFIDHDFFEMNRLPKNELGGSLNLVAVGNLRRQKNYRNLLAAFRLLKCYNIYLDIYGLGDLEKEFQSIIDEQQIKVKLKGRGNNIVEILPKYDAFIMSSSFEGYGIALAEAMAVGLPVIISDIEVLKEVAEEKAIYFNPENPESIAQAIIKALDEWQTFREQSLQNSAFIKQKASKQKYINSLTEIYNKYIH